MMKFLEKNEGRTIYGLIHKSTAVNNGWTRKKNVYLEAENWPYGYWPQYVTGAGAFMRREAALAISEAASTSENIIYIPIEDALFGGVLRVKACVGIQNYALMKHTVGNLGNLRKDLFIRTLTVSSS